MGAGSVPPDWAVVSLCRAGDRFDGHPYRRRVHLLDQIGDANADPDAVVDDVVVTIDAFIAEGRDVVVHCHHGASRTGLAMRAWLIRHHDLDEAEATARVRDVWPHTDLWNQTFTDHLRSVGSSPRQRGRRHDRHGADRNGR